MPNTGPVVHWDEVERKSRAAGEIASTWTPLGEAAGTVGVGVRRIEMEEGRRSTAFHVHGAEEEIFFVLAGRGVLYQGASSCEVAQGDCIVHRPEAEPHALRAAKGGLDVLAFGTRVNVEICWLPRAGMAWAGPTVVAAPGLQNLWEKCAAAGPLELPPGPRPPNVVSTESVAPMTRERPGRKATWRPLGRTAGAERTGLNLITLAPGTLGPPAHCHSMEEEIFVVLEGSGICTIGTDDYPVRRGSVVSRPPGTGLAHAFQAGADGLSLLAYGTREPGDIAYYPRSNKIYFRGLGLVGRVERLDYWDGEDEPIARV